MMDFAEAMHYLEGTERFGSRLGLERMRDMLLLLGSPEKDLCCLHIAGTNGKGSVCAYSAYMLAAAGLRVGLYCSPYVYEFGERIRILDGRDPGRAWLDDPKAGQISEEAVASTLSEIRSVTETYGFEGDSHPTHFEMLTMMAFLHFKAQACDVVVLETGLGGRLDSTNIIPPPKVAVITAIGLDHTNRLGHTYMEIAGEKAGILKKGTEVLCLYDQNLAIPDPEEAAKVNALFEQKASSLGIRLLRHRHEELEVLSHDLSGQSFRVRGMDGEPYRTKLLPSFEPDNALLAVKAVRALYPEISDDEVRFGLANCYWPARLEKLCDEPVVLIDGGHNPQGAKALRLSLNDLFPEGKNEIHVCSVMKDKDQKGMFREILKGDRVSRIYLTKPKGIPRAAAPEELAEKLKEAAAEEGTGVPEIVLKDSVAEACSEALALAEKEDSILLAWGSFYQAGEFKAALEAAAKI